MWIAALALAGLASAPPVDVQASYQPPAKGKGAAVSVTLVPSDLDVHVNQTPAPRLKLDPAAALTQPAAPVKPEVVPLDPDQVRYLDPVVPVLFPVSAAKGAPAGPHEVPASVVYYYCSKREGWCRRGATDVTLHVP